MGNCASQADQDEKAKSLAIDKQIEEDSKKFKKDCKILLLGSGESGKSTIVKQMKIIHQNGFSTPELQAFTSIVYGNVMDSAKAVVDALQRFEIQCEGEGNQKKVAMIEAWQMGTMGFTPEIAMAIKDVWGDAAIKQLMEKHESEFYLMDSADYFFQNLHRIASPTYVPNETDVLRARVKSTSITETRFAVGGLSIHMFDVGGQRSERRKWIHCFESVTSIIFCTALSEYDQVLLEEKGQNRMQESLVLFESIINSRWFLRTSIILFLNKIDVLKSKLPRVPLERYFPEYIGGNDINKAARYILWRFMQTNRAKLSVYPHLTQATDTSNIKLVFAAVKETILQNSLKDSGIL